VAHAAPRAAGDAGAALFDQHCARCHDVARIAAALRTDGGGEEAARVRVLVFLKQHGAASDAEDAEIVAFLRASVD
jgi:mono/diheme cytochrome c family protein